MSSKKKEQDQKKLEQENLVRIQVAKNMKYELSDSTWEELKDANLVDDYLESLEMENLEDIEDDLKALVKWADRFERAYKKRQDADRRKQARERTIPNIEPKFSRYIVKSMCRLFDRHLM
jgi:hypothetical protein